MQHSNRIVMADFWKKNGDYAICTLINQSDYEKNILKTIFRLQGQSIKDEMSSHNVVYFISIYDKMTYNVEYLFSTQNLDNYQADMAISPQALNQPKLLKYF